MLTRYPRYIPGPVNTMAARPVVIRRRLRSVSLLLLYAREKLAILRAPVADINIVDRLRTTRPTDI